MAIEVDHVFICCSPGAPEADVLKRIGLREGSGNTHPGQGTANRRFFFHNAYLELLWVSSTEEACSAKTRPTRLLERWSSRTSGACPFGVAFRPKDADVEAPPFNTWTYRPSYLPPGLTIEFAAGTSLQEPELFYLPFARRSAAPAHEPINHGLPIRDMAGVAIGLPVNTTLSEPSRLAASKRLVNYFPAEQHVLELAFFATHETGFDLRPELPLVLRTVVRRAE